MNRTRNPNRRGAPPIVIGDYQKVGGGVSSGTFTDPASACANAIAAAQAAAAASNYQVRDGNSASLNYLGHYTGYLSLNHSCYCEIACENTNYWDTPDGNWASGAHYLGTRLLYSVTASDLGWYGMYFATGTCYLKVWWDEIITSGSWMNNGSYVSSVISTTPRSFTFNNDISNGGLCLPVGFTGIPGNDAFDKTKWSTSGDYADTLPAPVWLSGSWHMGLGLNLANGRYSMIEGYEPPTDGSNQGYPR